MRRMASWVVSAFQRRKNPDSIYIDDPVKLLADPAYASLDDEEKKKAVDTLMDQTRCVTRETALLLHFYGIKPWERKKLTKIQVAGLLWNIPVIQNLKEFFARQSETEVGYAGILDMLDPSKAEDGLSHREIATFKGEVATAKKELGIK